MLDGLAIIISICTLAFSIWQFYLERIRNRKEATIHAFDDLEDNKSFGFLLSLSKTKIDDYVARKKDHDKRIENEWESICEALARLEHFAVGINTKVYDLKILNAMAGNQIIKTYLSCKKLIAYKRTGTGKENNYAELEKMVCALQKHRKKKGQAIPETD
ncbi:MAG: DUF4760 domain-containing protein [Ruminococcus sp.]